MNALGLTVRECPNEPYAPLEVSGSIDGMGLAITLYVDRYDGGLVVRGGCAWDADVDQSVWFGSVPVEELSDGNASKTIEFVGAVTKRESVRP